MSTIPQQQNNVRSQERAELNNLAMPSAQQERGNAQSIASPLNHVSSELSDIKMPSLHISRPANDPVPLSAPLEAASKNAKEEGPALATVGDKISQDISHMFRDKRSESGFVEVAKKIGRAILAFFTR